MTSSIFPKSKPASALDDQVVSLGMRTGSSTSGGDALQELRTAAVAHDPYRFVIVNHRTPAADGTTLAALVSYVWPPVMDDYITKPVKASTVEGKIKEWIGIGDITPLRH